MEIERAVRPPVEARTKNNIGDLANHNEIIHFRPVARIIFEIGILDHEHISGDRGQPGLQCASLASISLMVDGTDGDRRRRRFLAEKKLALGVEINSRSTTRSVRKIGL